MPLPLRHVNDLGKLVSPHAEVFGAQRPQLEYPGHPLKMKVESILLALLVEDLAGDVVEVDDALGLISLLIVLVVVEAHVLHHEISGL